jgi:hypothetical protein
MKRLLVSAAVLGLSSTAAYAAGPTASVNTSADATVVAPIAITNLVNGNATTLNFGQIAANAAPGTVNISSAGVLSSPNTPNLIVAGSTGSVPTFTVTGSPNLAYTGTVPANVSLTGPAGSTAMVATLTKSGGAASLSGTGQDTFTLSASLAVGAAQTPGSYHGTFAVTAAYN